MIAIVGGGVAGMAAALALAPRPVVLISRAGPGGEGSSILAQGGIAAALGAGDSAADHLADTLAAGDGLCDADLAGDILAMAGEAIDFLEHHGVRFDRRNGAFALGLEAAHSRRRILHARDSTGAEIVRALAAAVAACASVSLRQADVRRILTDGGAVTGLLLGDGTVLAASQILLATGGLGGLYADTTNPPGNLGQGIALAARAGAALADMEFVQFHPTALALQSDPLPLISEAVRGEGARLTDAQGAALLDDDLAPRDIVSRAIHAETTRGGRVFLDARALPDFAGRFPAILNRCLGAGIDPRIRPIPVRPAAHYHMGGIWTDAAGRSSVEGLWAVGECAATGLHGANRLASNSLLEGVVMAMRAARHIGPVRAVGPIRADLPPAGDIARIRTIVSRHLGILRDATGLRQAMAELLPMADSDAGLTALSLAVFADLRRETRGAHARADFPAQTTPVRRRMVLPEILHHAATTSATELT